MTVQECKADKALVEQKIKELLQAFSDKYTVRCYTLTINDDVRIGSEIPEIRSVDLVVHV